MNKLISFLYLSLATVILTSIYFLDESILDIQLHDTYFIVSNLDYIKFFGGLTGLLAAIYFALNNNRTFSKLSIFGLVVYTSSISLMILSFYQSAPSKYFDYEQNQFSNQTILILSSITTFAIFTLIFIIDLTRRIINKITNTR